MISTIVICKLDIIETSYASWIGSSRVSDSYKLVRVTAF